MYCPYLSSSITHVYEYTASDRATYGVAMVTRRIRSAYSYHRRSGPEDMAMRCKCESAAQRICEMLVMSAAGRLLSTNAILQVTTSNSEDIAVGIMLARSRRALITDRHTMHHSSSHAPSCKVQPLCTGSTLFLAACRARAPELADLYHSHKTTLMKPPYMHCETAPTEVATCRLVPL